MLTRREFLQLSIVSLLAFRLPSPAQVQIAETRPLEPQQTGNEWGFPLTFPAYFPESEPEPVVPTYDYYLNVIRNENG